MLEAGPGSIQRWPTEGAFQLHKMAAEFAFLPRTNRLLADSARECQDALFASTNFWAARWKNFKVRGVQDELLTTRSGSSGMALSVFTSSFVRTRGVSGRKRRSKFPTHGCRPAGASDGACHFLPPSNQSDRTDPLCVRCVHRSPNVRAASAADLATDGFRRCYRFSCGSTSEVACRAFVGRRRLGMSARFTVPVLRRMKFDFGVSAQVEGFTRKAGGKHDDICCAREGAAGRRDDSRLSKR